MQKMLHASDHQSSIHTSSRDTFLKSRIAPSTSKGVDLQSSMSWKKHIDRIAKIGSQRRQTVPLVSYAVTCKPVEKRQKPTLTFVWSVLTWNIGVLFGALTIKTRS